MNHRGGPISSGGHLSPGASWRVWRGALRRVCRSYNQSCEHGAARYPFRVEFQLTRRDSRWSGPDLHPGRDGTRSRFSAYVRRVRVGRFVFFGRCGIVQFRWGFRLFVVIVLCFECSSFGCLYVLMLCNDCVMWYNLLYVPGAKAFWCRRKFEVSLTAEFILYVCVVY